MANKPSITDIIKASKNVYRFLSPTPLRYYQGLSDQLAAKVWLKHENHNPTCAFKVRGGLNLLAGLNEEQRNAGIYTASTGNHGQSIAYAAQAYQTKATIFVPIGANPGKVASMRAYGAQVIFAGDDFDLSRAAALKASQDNKGTFVGPTDEVLIEGVGSYALEILQELPKVDVIIVPVGAGSGICATSIVAKAINPAIKIIGVQSAQAPAMQLSWEKRQLIESHMHTIAEGVATRVPFINTQEIMWQNVDEFILVDDKDIINANKILIESTHNLIEEASAATYAAALQIKAQLKDKQVVLIMTGGNISMSNLHQLFAD
jgi:threonine dehydratase